MSNEFDPVREPFNYPEIPKTEVIIHAKTAEEIMRERDEVAVVGSAVTEAAIQSGQSID